MDHAVTIYNRIGRISDIIVIPSQFVARNPVAVHQSIERKEIAICQFRTFLTGNTTAIDEQCSCSGSGNSIRLDRNIPFGSFCGISKLNINSFQEFYLHIHTQPVVIEPDIVYVVFVYEEIMGRFILYHKLSVFIGDDFKVIVIINRNVGEVGDLIISIGRAATHIPHACIQRFRDTDFRGPLWCKGIQTIDTVLVSQNHSTNKSISNIKCVANIPSISVMFNIHSLNRKSFWSSIIEIAQGTGGRTFHPSGRPVKVILLVCQQTDCKYHTEYHTNQNEPTLRLFPFCQIPNPAGGVTLTKSQRGTCKQAVSSCQVQQRSRIIRPDIFTKLAENSLIATHLHISACQHKCNPDQRIEPVNRQSQKAECLKNMIATVDVMPFVCNDVFSLGLV